MSQELLLSEKCGTLGRHLLYQRDEDRDQVVRVDTSQTLAHSLLLRLVDLLREVFLPHGYPESVSQDYYEYQVWDTVQAFCSTITGTLTTRAILKGIGVGDAQATPLAAAFTWILKDGTGMLGRIIFAWWKGTALDSDCKKWRLFADILNDAAMFLELLIPYLRAYSLPILCVTTSMKAVVGVAGSATRAAITQHQAIRGNMADVSAKDGSQETCVNLIASFVGLFLLAVFDGHYEWMIFFVLTIGHVFANYMAVCSLNIPHLNDARLVFILQTYLKMDTVDNPSNVNRKESVFIGFGARAKDVCGFHIKLGTSLKPASSCYGPEQLEQIISAYRRSQYLLVPNIRKRTIYVAFSHCESAEDVIAAYFHACLLGIALCYYNQVPLNIESKRKLHNMTPVIRLHTSLKSHSKNVSGREENLPLRTLLAFNEFVAQETRMFFVALKVNGWNLDAHAVQVGEWRAQWKSDDHLKSL